MPTGVYVPTRLPQKVDLKYSVLNSFPLTPVPAKEVWIEGVQLEASTLCFRPTTFDDALCLPRPSKADLRPSCGALRQYLPKSLYAGLQGATYPLDRHLALKAQTVLENGLPFEISAALQALVLAETPTPVTPAADPTCALAELVQAGASADGLAGGGWIYASWKTVTLWSNEHLLQESNGKLYTLGGVEVVPGLSLDEETYFVSGGEPVFHSSGVVILNQFGDTIKKTNTDSAIAELQYLAYWNPNPCKVFSVSVDCVGA